MTITAGDVRRFILDCFSDAELEALCFVYFQGVENAFSDGMPKEGKARALIDYCQNRGQVQQLFAALKSERPLVFAERFSGPVPERLDDEFPEAAPAVVSVSALNVSEIIADRIIAERTLSMLIFIFYLAGLVAGGLLIIAGAAMLLTDATRQIGMVGGLFICSLGALQVRGIIDRHAQRSRCQTVKDLLLLIRQGQGSVDAGTWKQIQDYLWSEMSKPVPGEKVLA